MHAQDSSARHLPGLVSKEWPTFAMSLAEVLAQLMEDQFLIISLKRSNRFVQFAGQGSFGVRAEVVANAFLSPDERIDEEGLAELRELGWIPPTGSPDAATPQQAPDGSPNYFMQCSVPVNSAGLAEVAVRTLHAVLGVPHPGFLEYQSFDADGNSLSFPSLGLREAPRAVKPNATEDPCAQWQATLRQITGIPDLAFDGDGDACLQYGDSLDVLISPSSDHSHVRIRTILAAEVIRSPDVFVRINEVNVSLRYLRVVLAGNAIFAVAEVPLLPFVPEHHAALLAEFCHVSKSLAESLRPEFAGSEWHPAPAGSDLRH